MRSISFMIFVKQMYRSCILFETSNRYKDVIVQELDNFQYIYPFITNKPHWILNIIQLLPEARGKY